MEYDFELEITVHCFKCLAFILEFNFPKWKVKSVEIMPVWKLDKCFSQYHSLVVGLLWFLFMENNLGRKGFISTWNSQVTVHHWEVRGTEVRNLEAGTESEVFGGLGRPLFIDLLPQLAQLLFYAAQAGYHQL